MSLESGNVDRSRELEFGIKISNLDLGRGNEDNGWGLGYGLWILI